MSKNTIIGIAVIIVLLGGYLFYKSAYQAAPSVNENPVVTGGNVVTLTDGGYVPSTLTIKKGDTVTFKNESSVAMWTASAMHPAHTGYSGTSLSEHCPDAANTSFDACRGYQPGESWSFTFNKVGSWGYHNHLSPSQWGKVIVE